MTILPKASRPTTASIAWPLSGARFAINRLVGCRACDKGSWRLVLSRICRSFPAGVAAARINPTVLLDELRKALAVLTDEGQSKPPTKRVGRYCG
jgi:hypothetical protein